MRFTRSVHCAFGVAAVSLAVAACNGGGVSPSASPASLRQAGPQQLAMERLLPPRGCDGASVTRQRAAGRPGFMRPHNKSAQLVYIANYYNSSVDVYSQVGNDQTQIGQITDQVNFPTSVAVSSTGDLYVASECTVTAYHEAGLHPFKTLHPQGQVFSLALTQKRVYAALSDSGLVNWFTTKATKPTGTLHDPNIAIIEYMTTNSHDDLIVNGINNNGCGSLGPDQCNNAGPNPNATASPNPCEIDSFPGGRQDPHILRTDCTTPEGMAVDGQDNLIFADVANSGGVKQPLPGSSSVAPRPQQTGGCFITNTISTYAQPYNQPATSAFTLCGFPTGIALRQDNQALWVANTETNGSCCYYNSAQEYSLTGNLMEQTSEYYSFDQTFSLAASPSNL